MILQLLQDAKDVLLILIGAILSIVTTMITNKRQHKMEMQRIAVQNKLDTSKKAISWLMQAKSELYVIIWYFDNHNDINDGMLNAVMERAERLTTLEIEARDCFNAIELYYNLGEINEKYNMEVIVPQMLSLQDHIATIKNNPQDNTMENLCAALEETKRMLKQLHEAISDIIELIRQDNLNYLK